MRKMIVAAVVAAFLFIPSAAATPEFRTLDGSNNNAAHPDWGQAGHPYLRVAAPNYADGIASMVDGPNARFISNRIFSDLAQNVFSENHISQWGWLWGQFLDHTFGLRDETPAESAPIPFNASDPLERFTDDFGVIDFARTPAAPGTGVTTPRQEINTVQSYIDGYPVYGETTSRLDWLRQGPVDGDPSDNSASLLLPGGYLPRADARGDASSAPVMDLFAGQVADPGRAVVAGDVRANENIALTAVQTLFAREHNRIVSLLPNTLSEETKFQIARRVVGAEEQYITYHEFLPELGVQLAPYTGYDPNVNATLSNEFATVGFRGHSTVRGEMEAVAPVGTYSQAQLDAFTAQGLAVEDGPTPNTVAVVVPLQFAFGNPDLVESLGLGPLLKGLAVQLQYRNDELIDDTLRSVLFQVPKPGTDPSQCGGDVNPNCFTGVSDLGAIDVMRGRDHGMPYYNDLRKAYGLAPKTSFAAITGESSEGPIDINDPHILDFTQLLDRFGLAVAPGTDAADEDVVTVTRATTLAARLKAIYGDVNKVDAFVGMSCEPHVPGTDFGELQLAIWKKQFTALRDGDRFFYLNDPFLTTIKQQYGIDFRHTLADIIRLDTGETTQPDAFKVDFPADAQQALGDQTVEPQADSDAAGQAEAFRTIVPGDGVVSSVSLWVGAGTTAHDVVVGLYTNRGGHPDSLIAEGSIVSPQTGAWNIATLPSTDLASGSAVWISVLGVDGTLAFDDRCCGGGGTSPSETNAQTGLADLPATWSPGTTYPDGPLSAFAVLAPSFAPMSVVGQQVVEPQLDRDAAGLAEAFQVTAPRDGSLSSLNVFLDPTSASTQLVAGIYTDSNGHPGTLLTSGTAQLPLAGTWNPISVSPVSLSGGTTYWLALLSPAGAGPVMFRDSCCGVTGTGASETSAQTTLTALPATWSSGNRYEDGPISMFG